MYRWLFVAALVAAFVFLAPLVRAQSVTLMAPTPCVPVAKLDGLTKEHGENSVGAGLSATGKYIYEFYLSSEGTFSLVMRDTHGMACLIGSGINWTTIRAPVAGRGL